jgi:hypothetical protein
MIFPLNSENLHLNQPSVLILASNTIFQNKFLDISKLHK